MNIGVAIVSTRKWKLASFSRSVLIFGVSSARFVVLMNIENPCCSRRSSKTKGSGLVPRPQQRDLSASGRCSSGDLVGGGIGNLIGLYPRSSVNHLPQGLAHFGASSPVVDFRAFRLVPPTASKIFLCSRYDKRDFDHEAPL